MASCYPKAITFFEVLHCLSLVFSSSIRKQKILKDHVPSLTVNLLSQTRHESHIVSVKTNRFQAPKIIDAFFELAKASDDPKINNEANSLAIHEPENFEFLVGTVIWYDLLFVVNGDIKTQQAKGMQFDFATDQLKALFTFLKSY